jgi:outer membrane protein assembly factor BamD (BamD/ComL family)
MRYSALAAGLLALALSACASIGSMLKNGEDHYEAGLRAFKAGDYAGASEHLSLVAGDAPEDKKGRQALLMLAALEMDTRNPNRRLALGSDHAGSFLKLKGTEPWMSSIAQTLYLMSVELGAAEERAAQAEADKQQAEGILQALPKDFQSWPSRLRASEEKTDRLAKKVEQLEAQVADRDKKLIEKDKELERIKKTLKS